MTTQQAQELAKQGKINKTKNKITKTYTEIFLKNIFSLLNIILFAMFGMLVANGLWSHCFFAIVLFINLFIGIFQDIRAKKLVEKISLTTSPKSIVIRDNIEQEIPSDSIVLGDTIILKAGMTVPSDCEIIKGDVKVNESLLTGENDAIERLKGAKLYKESIILSGRCTALVIAVGKDNYTHKLQSKAKNYSRPKSELLTSLNKILRFCSIIAICLGIAELTIFLLQKYSFIELTSTLASSIVAMIPNGMVLLTSLTLTVGVITLINRKMLVQEMYSIESLARINVMCVDKTGTLTDGNMEVVGKYSKEMSSIISHILFATKDDNITAKALRLKFGENEIKGGYETIFFDSSNKYSGYKTITDTFVIGAYGFATKDEKWLKRVKNAENQGYRVLCVVKNNKCIGIITLQEHIKPQIEETIHWFKENDVRVVVISGDSPLSIKAVANKVGISGDAISLLDLKEEQVKELVRSNKYDIFGRVSPEQKLLIIQTLKEMDNQVAMVGDGVNDLLALKNADCSIAMNNGSDAIKSASHLLSLDNNFTSFPKVVEEGRRVINNLQRVCSLFLIKTIFAITFSLAFLIGTSINKDILYPFSTNNLYPFEAIFIGLSAFLIALEPNRTRINGNFFKETMKKTLPAALTFVLCISLILSIGAAMDQYVASVNTAIIAMNLIFIIYIWSICSPLSKYRLIILSITTFIEVGFIILDYVITTFTNIRIFHDIQSAILDINYSSITPIMLLIGIIAIISMSIIYLLVNTKIKDKNDTRASTN